MVPIPLVSHACVAGCNGGDACVVGCLGGVAYLEGSLNK